MGLVSLVVMEKGSEWPGHVGDFEHLVIVGGGGGGGAGSANEEQALAEGMRERIDGLRRRGQRVRIAVLACSEALDTVSRAARTQMAHRLLAAVASHPFGRLVMSAPERPSLGLRRELMSLVSALSARLTGTTVTVTLRFGRAASSDPADAADRAGNPSAPRRRAQSSYS